MSSILETKGAPRDLGFAQGVACRAAIQKNVANHGHALRAKRSLLGTLFGAGSSAPSVARDLSRFFPHHAERSEGLARGADVAAADLMTVLAAELGGAVAGVTPATLGLHFGVIDKGAASQPLLFKTVETGMRVPRRPLARKTAPDNGYVSVELVFPETVFSIAGVNECGLAMVVSVPREVRTLAEPIAAPASLLGQDCLLRFDAAEKAVDWCMTRPAGGVAELIFADAAGHLMGVEIRGKERKLTLPFGGLLFGMPEQARSLALQTQIQHLNALSSEALWSVLQTHAAEEQGGALAACRHGAWLETSAALIVDPCARSLRWTERAPCATRFEDLICATL